MKIVLMALFMFSSLAFAQVNNDAVVTPSSDSPEPVADVQGPYAKPTADQKAAVHAAAKKAKKKKMKKKAVKKAKKTKKSTQ